MVITCRILRVCLYVPHVWPNEELVEGYVLKVTGFRAIRDGWVPAAISIDTRLKPLYRIDTRSTGHIF